MRGTTGHSASLENFLLGHTVERATSRYMKDKKVVGSSQHGFTKGKSCLTNLIAFCNERTGSVDEERAVDIVYLNFSKAFNTVSHNILLDKQMKLY